jgi:lipooligosaccharide transport system permease protein
MTTVTLPRVARAAWRRPDVSWLALRVWQRNRDVYLNTWKAEAMWPLVEPLLTLIALGVGLGDFVDLGGDGSYVDFIAPGMLAVYPMWMAAAEMGWGSFFRMESQGTFNAIVSTPASVDDVTSGEILWGSTRAFVSICFIMVMVLALGTVESPLALLIFPLSFLPGMMFAAMALSYTAVARTVSSLNYFFAAYITPQYWLAGVFFPLDQLPGWVQTVAWFTPAYHAVRVYRGLVQGELQWDYLINIAWMAVVTAVFYALALHLMRRRLIK